MSGFKFEGIHYTIQNTDINAEQGHLVIYANNDQLRIVDSNGQYKDLHIRNLYADNVSGLENYTLNSTTFNLVSDLQNQIDNQNIETHKTVQTNPSFVLKPDGVGGLTWGTISLSGAAVSHQFLNDLQGGQANQYFHLNYAQYQDYIGKTTVQQISGTLNKRIDDVVATSISGNLSTYTPLTTTASISGYLNSKIDSINLLAGDNVTIVESPANVWTISSTGGTGGGTSGDLSLYTLLSTTKEVSGALQASKANVLHDITTHTTNEINALYFLRPNGLGGVMWAPVSISGSQVDHNTLSNLQGGQFNQYYHLNQSQLQDFIGKSTVASISASLTLLSTTQSISGSLQNQIRTHSSDISRLAAVTGSYLTAAVVDGYTPLTTTSSISGSLQSQINAISGSYLSGTLVTTLGNPGLDTNVPSEKAVRSALNALNLVVSGGGSGSGGGGWGSSSQLTMTQQTTGLTAGSAVRFTSTTGDHALSNYQVTLKAGTKSELSAELLVVYNANNSWSIFQWYNVTAAAYIGPTSTDVPISYTGSNASYTKQVKAQITVASDTVVELRIKTVSGTISSIENDSYAVINSTLPQSNNTASDTYTSNSSTVITTAASASLLDLTCGNVASGLYTVDGRWYQTNNAAGFIKLQASSDGGTNWTDLEALGTHFDAQSDHAIKGTYKHNQQLGNLVFRIYYATEGNSITFGISGDLRFGRKLTAVGPINSPSFGGGWGACSLATMSAVQTTGITDGLPVKFDTISGDHTISSNRIKLKAGSKNVLTACLEVDFNSSSGGLHYQWYSYGTSSYIGTLGESIPSTYSTYHWGSNTIATATLTVASDTEVELRIRGITNGSLTTPSQVAWIRNYSGASSTASSSWAKIESTTPTGGAWAKSSVLTLAGTQSTGLTAGSPIQFANITGDHLLSNYGVTVKGGSVAMLRAGLRITLSASGTYANLRWYNVSTSSYEGEAFVVVATTWAGDSQSNPSSLVTRVSPTTDSVYQLRIESISSGTIT